MTNFIFDLLFFSHTLWARAGGAGGGHGGGGYGGGGYHGGGGGSYYGGGYGGSGGVYYGGGGDSSFVFVIVILVVIYLVYRYQQKHQFDSSHPAEYIPRENVVSGSSGDLSGLGDSSTQAFTEKACTAFLTIQQSWSEKRLDLMRRFISDGVYQRFHAQFVMMDALDESNPITDVLIQGAQIVSTHLEGVYECVDVRISAVATDQFVSRKFPQMNSPGGREAFSEYWSFIRRRDHVKGTDIFQSESCPKCGGALAGKLMDTARCPYCGTYINSGEYDWVLAEITQEEDYGVGFARKFRIPQMLTTPANQLLANFPSFSRLVLEDRASNAFMQILIAKALRKADALQRFTTNEAFEKLKNQMPDTSIAFDRLYTRSVELLGAQLIANQVRAYVAVEYSAHEVSLSRPQNFLRDEEPDSMAVVLVLLRELSTITAKGSVFAGSCPHCGAPQGDSLSVVCAYCAGALNDPKLDWLVEDVMDFASFRSNTALFR